VPAEIVAAKSSAERHTHIRRHQRYQAIQVACRDDPLKLLTDLGETGVVTALLNWRQANRSRGCEEKCCCEH